LAGERKPLSKLQALSSGKRFLAWATITSDQLIVRLLLHHLMVQDELMLVFQNSNVAEWQERLLTGNELGNQ